ncbi:MAG: nitroreductase family protein [Candidatus Methanofastidiosia archaeon]|jgi:nitroreductase
MDVKEAIQNRRAYRSLTKVPIDTELIRDLAECAQIAPSCYNNQPWRFVFVYTPKKLDEVYTVLSQGNQWAYQASMIIAVVSKKDFDCVVKGREYYLFDTGMACAFIILRATELGLVAHPIAGYNEEQVKKILRIPHDMQVITLVNVGEHAKDMNPALSEKQAKSEKKRPERLSLNKIMFLDEYEV